MSKHNKTKYKAAEDKESPIKNNFVHKHMEEFNRPSTVELKTAYKRRPKLKRPLHEIDADDPYLNEEDIWNE